MNKLKKGITLGLLSLASVGVMSVGVNADQSTETQGTIFTYADYDLNGDGKIVEQEFNEANEAWMAKMAEEGHQTKNAEGLPGFAGIDTDADGVISEEEFATHQAKHHLATQNQKEPLASN